MNRILILACILVLCTAMEPACQVYHFHGGPYVPEPKKVTYLHFFLHDTISGYKPSAVMVARPNMPTAFSDTTVPFGSLYATNDPLTVGPNRTSEVIGNAKGLWVSAGEDVIELVVYWDLGFTQGEFTGSSINLFSRNPITEKEREVAVIGGKGKFRMATGFAHLKTYFMDEMTGDAIVEYKVTLIH